MILLLFLFMIIFTGQSARPRDQVALKTAKKSVAAASPSTPMQRYATPPAVSVTRRSAPPNGKEVTKPRSLLSSSSSRATQNKGCGVNTEHTPVAQNSASVKPIYIDMRPVSRQGDTSLLSLASDTPVRRQVQKPKKVSAVTKSVAQRPDFSISTAKEKPAPTRASVGSIQGKKSRSVTPRSAMSSTPTSTRIRVRPDSAPRARNRGV